MAEAVRVEEVKVRPPQEVIGMKGSLPGSGVVVSCASFGHSCFSPYLLLCKHLTCIGVQFTRVPSSNNTDKNGVVLTMNKICPVAVGVP